MQGSGFLRILLRLREFFFRITVIGFPLGAMSTGAKAAEAALAVKDGAQELDMVIHTGMAKSGNWDYVKKDIKAVVQAAEGRALVKVILETCLLTDEEKEKACLAAKEAGADFVKTSTGLCAGPWDLKWV